ncbi:MAG: hypothetical protein EHM24_05325, partial [Acidobacteria bacterium]
MTCFAVGGRVAGVVLLLLSGCSLSILPCGSQPLPAASSPDLLVPGGTAALLTAAGVQVPVEPARAVLVLTRQLHGPFAPLTGTNALEPVRAALATAAGRRRGAERIPGLLPLATWGEAVFGQAVAEANLVARILSDERASFLYCGLFALDEETLAFFVSHPGLLRTVHRNAAASFAAYSGG